MRHCHCHSIPMSFDGARSPMDRYKRQHESAADSSSRTQSTNFAFEFSLSSEPNSYRTYTVPKHSSNPSAHQRNERPWHPPTPAREQPQPKPPPTPRQPPSTASPRRRQHSKVPTTSRARRKAYFPSDGTRPRKSPSRRTIQRPANRPGKRLVARLWRLT
jgi:hypothetical protein